MNTVNEQTVLDKYATPEDITSALEAMTPVAGKVNELDDPGFFFQAVFSRNEGGIIDGLYEVTDLFNDLMSFFLVAENAAAFEKHCGNTGGLSHYLPEIIYRLNRYVASDYAHAWLEKFDVENNTVQTKEHIDFLIKHYGRLAKVIAFEQ